MLCPGNLCTVNVFFLTDSLCRLCMHSILCPDICSQKYVPYLAAAFWAHPPDPGPCSSRCTGCPRRRSHPLSPQHSTTPLAPPTTAGREEGAGAKPASQCSSCPLPWRQAQRERGFKLEPESIGPYYRYKI